MMNTMRVLAASLLLLAAAMPAAAQDPPEERPPAVSSRVTVDFLSHYVWRGIRLSDGFVMQPSFGVESHGFSVNAWWNWDYSRPSGSSPLVNETDLTVAYSRAAGRTTFSGGLIYYGMQDAPDTTEFYGSVSREMPLAPTLSLYYDVDEGDGALAMLSVGHEIALPASVTLALSAAASYNMNHRVMGTGLDEQPFVGFYHGEVGLSVSLPVARRLTLAPRITYSFPLTDQARYAMEGASYDGKTSSLVSGGLGLVIEF